jgi:hypothetical protein
MLATNQQAVLLGASQQDYYDRADVWRSIPRARSL